MRRKITAFALSALVFVACQPVIGKESSGISRIPQSEFAPVFVSKAKITPSLAPVEPSERPQEPLRQPLAIGVVSKPAPIKRTHKVTVIRAGKLSITEGRALAKSYARSRVSSAQYSCLVNIWNHESGWNYLDYNRSSGAYGIPQALPGSKMSSAGSDWRTNPITQVKWGLGYIDGRYGSPCRAWSFWTTHRWY